ncbi:MAG: hypothetical protein PHI27_03050 [Eubacteriales bacterium]|nr:hypothetical protein [Eubacteriales bacterium]MDD3881213.1 hypothetical protein [Eubacteriales bacterium]MDD4512131.1 hypothetical protein [Eubacteriales bacterium]
MKYFVDGQLCVRDATAMVLSGADVSMECPIPFATDDGRKGVILSVGISSVREKGKHDVLTSLTFGKMPEYILTDDAK